MTFDFERISASKRAYRRRLAQEPIVRVPFGTSDRDIGHAHVEVGAHFRLDAGLCNDAARWPQFGQAIAD